MARAIRPTEFCCIVATEPFGYILPCRPEGNQFTSDDGNQCTCSSTNLFDFLNIKRTHVNAVKLRYFRKDDSTDIEIQSENE